MGGELISLWSGTWVYIHHDDIEQKKRFSHYIHNTLVTSAFRKISRINNCVSLWNIDLIKIGLFISATFIAPNIFRLGLNRMISLGWSRCCNRYVIFEGLRRWRRFEFCFSIVRFLTYDVLPMISGSISSLMSGSISGWLVKNQSGLLFPWLNKGRKQIWAIFAHLRRLVVSKFTNCNTIWLTTHKFYCHLEI